VAIITVHGDLTFSYRQQNPTNYAPNLDTIGKVGLDREHYEFPDWGFSGTVADNLPIAILPAETLTVHGKTCSFVDDYYNRIHINPNTLGLGNLLASQERSVEVWNAYLTPKLLSSITEEGTDSLTLVGPASPPTTFASIEARNYDLTIAIDGPPVINASYGFNFPDSETVTLAVTGRRVVVWPFVPQTTHRETLEWKTDILKAFSKEQRLALRDAPRQMFDYTFQLDERQLTKAQGTATSWAYRVYGIGVWAEADFFGAVSSGDTAFVFDTTFKDYRAGGLVLLWESDQLFEAISVATVTDSGITLDLPTAFDYTNAHIMPLRLARTLQGIQFTRQTGPYSIARGSFLATDNENLGESELFDQYRERDVLTDRQVTVSQVTDRISRRVDMFDNGSGPIEVDIQDDWVNKNSIITFDTDTREQRWKVRSWLHYLRGRQKAFWLPSWNPDLHLVFDVNDLATSITCSPIGYELFYSTKDIMIQLYDGTRVYNRILAVTLDGDGNEVFTLDEAVGIDLVATEIEMISFMGHVRLNTDRVEFTHTYAGRCYTSMAVIETPEEE